MRLITLKKKNCMELATVHLLLHVQVLIGHDLMSASKITRDINFLCDIHEISDFFGGVGGFYAA
jgi:hypothetical protein